MTERAAQEAKVDLDNLCKIPPQELEKHFYKWMESDNVARELQAKLRADLIKNFNKTTLGKQILCQSTSIGGGSGIPRLTLTPLMLGLNTLVAEFLYTQNCHFTLSVFCTEVPFRNILPDFESMRHFRFADDEIKEILQALCSTTDYNIRENEIIQNYSTDVSVSLLFLILKTLLQRIAVKTRSAPTQVPSPMVEVKAVNVDATPDTFEKNFLFLNQYLILLSKRVKHMSKRLRNLHQQRGFYPERKLLRRHRCRTASKRKYECLNRSFERITENLKQMSHSECKNKQVKALLSAINQLGAKFAQCAENIDCIRRHEIARSIAEKTVSDVKVSKRDKETETEPIEKTYSEWLHEMRSTKNGQKFLDRIEAALQKALNKQKEKLKTESEMKLRHQKELLKIHFKRKLIKQLSNHASATTIGEKEKLKDELEQKMKLFEAKHFELLTQMQDTNSAKKEATPNLNLDHVSHRSEVQVSSRQRTPRADLRLHKHLSLHEELNKQKQLQEMVRNISDQERTVDHIVYDAKLRIQELENESNQLERNFLNYLERQRQQKEATHDATKKLWEYYVDERSKLHKRYIQFRNSNSAAVQNGQYGVEADENDNNDDEGYTADEDNGEEVDDVVSRLSGNLELKAKQMNLANHFAVSDTEVHNLIRRNAISDAKNKLFQTQSVSRELNQREYEQEKYELSLNYMGESNGEENCGYVASNESIISKILMKGNANVKPQAVFQSSTSLPQSDEDLPTTGMIYSQQQNAGHVYGSSSKSSTRVATVFKQPMQPTNLNTVEMRDRRMESKRKQKHLKVLSPNNAMGYELNSSKQAVVNATKSADVLQISMEKMRQIFTDSQTRNLGDETRGSSTDSPAEIVKKYNQARSADHLLPSSSKLQTAGFSKPASEPEPNLSATAIMLQQLSSEENLAFPAAQIFLLDAKNSTATFAVIDRLSPKRTRATVDTVRSSTTFAVDPIRSSTTFTAEGPVDTVNISDAISMWQSADGESANSASDDDGNETVVEDDEEEVVLEKRNNSNDRADDYFN